MYRIVREAGQAGPAREGATACWAEKPGMLGWWLLPRHANLPTSFLRLGMFRFGSLRVHEMRDEVSGEVFKVAVMTQHACIRWHSLDDPCRSWFARSPLRFVPTQP